MSRLFALANAVTLGQFAPPRAAERTRSLSRQERWAIFFLTLSLAGGVAYLFIVNSLATAGFMEKAKLTHLKTLQAENAVLVAEREGRRSWDALAARLPELNLVESKRVEYVNAVVPSTAQAYAVPTP